MMKFSSVQNSRTISVVIPTCDRPISYLKAAVESALDQTLSPLEVLVIDNGTNAADRSQLPESVRYHRITPRVGVSRARNRGAELAQGSFLAFLDDDDWWDKDFLKEAMSVLEAEGTSCAFTRKDVYRDGTVQPFKCPSRETVTIENLLQRNPGTGGQNMVVEKLLYKSLGGFNERLWTSEDKAFVIDLLLRGEQISFAPNAIAVVRPHDGPRLSHDYWNRLRFIWRYRKLYGPMGVVRRTIRLFQQIRKSRKDKSAK